MIRPHGIFGFPAGFRDKHPVFVTFFVKKTADPSEGLLFAFYRFRILPDTASDRDRPVSLRRFGFSARLSPRENAAPKRKRLSVNRWQSAGRHAGGNRSVISRRIRRA